MQQVKTLHSGCFYNILIIIGLIVFVLPYYTYRLFREKGFGLRFKQQVFGQVDEKEIEDVITRFNTFADKVIRGDILSSLFLISSSILYKKLLRCSAIEASLVSFPKNSTKYEYFSD